MLSRHDIFLSVFEHSTTSNLGRDPGILDRHHWCPLTNTSSFRARTDQGDQGAGVMQVRPLIVESASGPLRSRPAMTAASRVVQHQQQDTAGFTPAWLGIPVTPSLTRPEPLPHWPPSSVFVACLETKVWVQSWIDALN